MKPPLRMTPDRLFLIVLQEEFKEYTDFLEHHDALFPFDQKERYFIKDSLLLDYTTQSIWIICCSHLCMGATFILLLLLVL